ncbi:MAG TPA: hypothetical protein VFS00_25930 [Polyangiaceae bacterium]|nr:hypothetical protein [Polyangiaceae bacterium]
MSAGPLAPFDAWPVQVFDPAFGFAWYVSPATFVSQATTEQGTLASVIALHDLIDGLLAAKAAEVRAAGGLLVLHDWRLLRGYDRDAGVAFVERVTRREPGYLRRAVVAVRGGRELLLAAVEGVAFLGAVAPEAHLDLVADLGPALLEEGVQPPPAGERFPAP